MAKKAVEYHFLVKTIGIGMAPAGTTVGDLKVKTKSTDMFKVVDIGFENLSKQFEIKGKFDFNGCSSSLELAKKHFALHLDRIEK